MAMTENKPKTKRGRPATVVPAKKLKTDEKVSLSVKKTLTRSAGCLQKLLSWSESTLEQIEAGEVDVSVGLVDSLLKAIVSISEKLPRIQRELSAAKKAEEDDGLANDDDNPAASLWTPEMEDEFLRDFAETDQNSFEYQLKHGHWTDQERQRLMELRAENLNQPREPEAAGLEQPRMF
jgi:hypothetical protein